MKTILQLLPLFFSIWWYRVGSPFIVAVEKLGPAQYKLKHLGTGYTFVWSLGPRTDNLYQNALYNSLFSRDKGTVEFGDTEVTYVQKGSYFFVSVLLTPESPSSPAIYLTFLVPQSLA